MSLSEIVSSQYDLTRAEFRSQCREKLDSDGVLVLKDFIREDVLAQIRGESAQKVSEAYFCTSRHNVYLTPPDPGFSLEHQRNRQVVSTKGLIADDQISEGSSLKRLYENDDFREFVASVVSLEALFPYADPLSAVNVHYAQTGQELGWHFDNSSFAITLLIDKPEAGGVFEYVKDVRDADAGDFGFETVGALLDGKLTPETVSMEPGTLVLFRGRNSIHRVTPTQGNKTRILAVLAYNSEPGVELSESARATFYGRLV